MGGHKVMLFFFTFAMLQCSFVARRINKEKPHLQNKGQFGQHGQCPCFVDNKCSSCSFTKCPFTEEDTKWTTTITAFSGGATSATPMSGGIAAWGVRANGKRYVVKFAGDPMENGVFAAQLGHAMGVVTPRQLVVNTASCPGLWKIAEREDEEQDDDHKIDERFLKSLKYRRTKQVSIQELAETQLEAEQRKSAVFDEEVVAKTKTTQDENLQSNLWYQAGLIASFEWIIGKADMFNDVPSDFDAKPDGLPSVEPNLGNIWLDDSDMMCISIDLDITMPNTEWDEWKAICEGLRGLSQGTGTSTMPWIHDVLLPILTLVKENGVDNGIKPAKEMFGTMNFETFKGFDDDVSPLLMQLGLLDGIIRAMFVASDQYAEKDKFKSMPGYDQGKLSSASWQDWQSLRQRYSAKIIEKSSAGKEKERRKREADAKREEQYNVCCQVHCTRLRHRGGLFLYDVLGTYQETCNEKTTKNFAPKYMKLKLVRGQKVYAPGTLMAKRVGNRNEKDCADAGSKRSGKSDFFDGEVQLLCKPQCAWDEKERPVTLKKLEDVDKSLCD